MKEPVRATPPMLETRRLKLRPVEDDDVAFVYELATGPDSGWRWRWRGYVGSREDIARDLAGDSLLVLMIDDKKAMERVGILHAYGASLHDGFAYVGVAVGKAYVGTGLGLEAFFLFINYMFTVWDLRKIYVEIPEFNADQAADRGQGLFEVEAHFKAHQFYDGRHWDKFIWAIYRDAWLEKGRPLLQRLLPRD